MGPLEDVLLGPGRIKVHKVLFMGEEDRIQAIRQQAEAMVHGQATLTRALSGMLEVLPPSASKGAGVTRVLQHLGVSPDDVMALGDGENDIEMLQLAGVRFSPSVWLCSLRTLSGAPNQRCDRPRRRRACAWVLQAFLADAQAGCVRAALACAHYNGASSLACPRWPLSRVHLGG